MDVSKGYSVKFEDEASQKSVIIDDDGRVAYAYLIAADGNIISDVWIYNRGVTPIEPEWKNRENMPFANPVDFANDSLNFVPPNDLNQLSVEWLSRDGKTWAQVFVDRCLIAELCDGAKPGWARLAKRDGPLARVLEIV